MHLADYMHRNKLTDYDVADGIGRHRASVSRYRRGKERPDWDTIQAIRIFTEDKVREIDWRVPWKEPRMGKMWP